MTDDADAAPPDAAEGVIRFSWRFRSAQAPDPAPIAALSSIHRSMLDRGWIGRDPERYGGLAFGNLSLGTGAPGGGFWITASQRIDRPHLDAADLVFVERVADGEVIAHGTRAPSSETLTHAAVHAAAGAGPLAVFHGHAPALWQASARLDWRTTPQGAANGTHALADAVRAQVRAHPDSGALAMLGHEDGILLWAHDFVDIERRLEAAARHIDHRGDAAG